jgi:hypothetical protein
MESLRLKKVGGGGEGERGEDPLGDIPNWESSAPRVYLAIYLVREKILPTFLTCLQVLRLQLQYICHIGKRDSVVYCRCKVLVSYIYRYVQCIH